MAMIIGPIADCDLVLKMTQVRRGDVVQGIWVENDVMYYKAIIRGLMAVRVLLVFPTLDLMAEEFILENRNCCKTSDANARISVGGLPSVEFCSVEHQTRYFFQKLHQMNSWMGVNRQL